MSRLSVDKEFFALQEQSIDSHLRYFQLLFVYDAMVGMFSSQLLVWILTYEGEHLRVKAKQKCPTFAL